MRIKDDKTILAHVLKSAIKRNTEMEMFMEMALCESGVDEKPDWDYLFDDFKNTTGIKCLGTGAAKIPTAAPPIIAPIIAPKVVIKAIPTAVITAVPKDVPMAMIPTTAQTPVLTGQPKIASTVEKINAPNTVETALKTAEPTVIPKAIPISVITAAPRIQSAGSTDKPKMTPITLITAEQRPKIVPSIAKKVTLNTATKTGKKVLKTIKSTPETKGAKKRDSFLKVDDIIKSVKRKHKEIFTADNTNVVGENMKIQDGTANKQELFLREIGLISMYELIAQQKQQLQNNQRKHGTRSLIRQKIRASL